MASEHTAKISVVDLNKDIFLQVKKYLSVYDICSLLEACKKLRDILYDPVFRGDIVFKLPEFDREVLSSLQARKVKTIMFIDEAGTFSEALQDHILLDNIERIVCQHNRLVSFEASETLKANFANLRCLILQLMVPKLEDMVNPSSCFENFFSALDGLTELHIHVQGLCMLASGDVKLMELIACNLPNLKDLDISRADDDNPDFQILTRPPFTFGNCLSVEKA